MNRSFWFHTLTLISLAASFLFLGANMQSEGIAHHLAFNFQTESFHVSSSLSHATTIPVRTLSLRTHGVPTSTFTSEIFPVPSMAVVSKQTVQPVYSKIVSLGATSTEVLYLNQALALLGYLPLSFTPSPMGAAKQQSQTKSSTIPSNETGSNTTSSTGSNTTNNISSNSTTNTSSNSTTNMSSNSTSNMSSNEANMTFPMKQSVRKASVSLLPPMDSQHLQPGAGQFHWLYSVPYHLLGSVWNPNRFSVVTQGAVMQFQSAVHLPVDGVAGPQVWTALAKALTSQNVNKVPYVYITVTTVQPERLIVWSGNKILNTSLANTGISVTPTQDGTWPIYLRLMSQTMSGTLPTGGTYSDPGVPWINYFHGGDAVHGFIRSSYGYPQSLGCVELPPSNAKLVYMEVQLGTLVTITEQQFVH